MRTLEWAAGLFEGEGTIIIRTRPEDQIDCQLSSVDEDVVREFASVIGCGKVHGPYQYGNRQPYWKWCAYGDGAVTAIERIRPYLLSRRAAKADEAVTRYDQRQKRPHYTVSRKGMGGRKKAA